MNKADKKTSKSVKKSKNENKEKEKNKSDKKEKKHKAKKERKEGEPKKPQTAYFLFCAEKRAENTNQKLSAKELGELYKKLPEAEKEKYKKLKKCVTNARLLDVMARFW